MTDADDNQDIDEFITEFSRPGRGDLAERVSGCYLIDLSDLRGFSPLPPHRKIVVMFLLLCLKDRASELRFEPRLDDSGERGVRMSYVVDKGSYDLIPPPTCLAPQIGQELARLAGLLSLRSRIGGLLRSLAACIDGQPTGPASGRFRVGAGGAVSDVRVIVTPSPGGDRVVLSISEVDPALSQSAATSLRRIFDERRPGRRAGSEGEPEIA